MKKKLFHIKKKKINTYVIMNHFIIYFILCIQFSDAPLAINRKSESVNYTFQSDDQDSLSMCEQCKNEALITCSSNLLPIILSVAVTCLLTIIIHVIIIVVFTITMKRKSMLEVIIFLMLCMLT